MKWPRPFLEIREVGRRARQFIRACCGPLETDNMNPSLTKWARIPSHWEYYALAIFNIATVCLSLVNTYDLETTYEYTVESCQRWSKWSNELSHLNVLAAAINAPGNDVFESDDIGSETAKLENAEAEFAKCVAELRNRIGQHSQGDENITLSVNLARAEKAVAGMSTEARLVFGSLRERKTVEATRHMAAMDRRCSEAQGALTDARAAISLSQREFFLERTEAGRRRRWREIVLAALVISAVGLVTVHGNSLAKRIRTAMEETLAAKNAAELANGTKSEFLANMSHEIRTPMTAIMGYAEILMEHGDVSKAPEQRIEAIRTIQRNGDHLLSIINDILDLSKIEAGKLAIERMTCSPVAIMKDVISLHRPRATAKKIDLSVAFVGEIPETVQTDPTRLRQILVNLVGNAVKFTMQGSVRILIGLAGPTDRSRLEFDVIDTGIGMSADQQEHLFQPFSQGDASMSRNFGGTGLGLVICRRLAYLLGGDVTIVSSAPGIGSRFRLAIDVGPIFGLKLVAPTFAAVVEPAKSEVRGNATERVLTGCRLLLAEDGLDNQRLISTVLRRVGAEVTVVENGRLAVDEAWQAKNRGNAYDMILMDMQMPVMDGYEAVALLRAKGYTGRIMALTAHAMSSDREKCLACGCDDFATKPIQRNALIESIARGWQFSKETAPVAGSLA